MLWLPTERIRHELGLLDNDSGAFRRASALVRRVSPSGETSIRIAAGATAYRVAGSRFIESLLALVNVFATTGVPDAKPVSAVVLTLEPGPFSDERGLLILWNEPLIESQRSSESER